MREVEAGAEVVILRFGKPVAQFVPVRARALAKTENGRYPSRLVEGAG